MPLLHHLALTASDLGRSVAFFDGLLTHFGYARTSLSDLFAAWEGPDFELLLYRAAPTLCERRHEIYQPGFHHLALRAPSRNMVETIHRWLAEVGADIHDPPGDYPAYPGKYFAVFFRDPDGLKLEVVHSG